MLRAPLIAHTVGVSTDLPVAFTVVLYGAFAALVATHVLAPRLAAAADRAPRGTAAGDRRVGGTRTARLGADRRSGAPDRHGAQPARPTAGIALLPARITAALTATGRLLGVALFVLVVAAAVAGASAPTLNPAPYAVLVVLWTGGVLASAFVGDLWAVLSPFESVRRLYGSDRRPAPLPDLGHRPAAGLLLLFVWYVHAHPAPDQPRSLARGIALYVLVIAVGSAWRGVGWLASAEAFGALFRQLAAVAPLATGPAGRLRLRAPGVGLLTDAPVAGTGALLVVALSGGLTDEVHGLEAWDRLVGTTTGWSAALIDSAGFVVVLAVVGLLCRWAAREASRASALPPAEAHRVLTPALVPVTAGLLGAHGLGMVIAEGSRFLALLSDPFDRGWDLLGTSGWGIDYASLPSRLLAVTQLVLLLAGPIAAIVVVHLRLSAHVEPVTARRAAQAPFLAAVGLGVAGLYLVLGGAG